MSRRLALVAAVSLMSSAIGSCYVGLPFPGGGRGYVLTAHNQTTDALVVFATERSGDRYYLVPPGADVIVDGVGEGNPPTDVIKVLDGTCTALDTIDADFSNGGTLTITAAGTDFAPTQLGPGDDRPGAFPTCQEALAQH
jgi:hypothetical protein